MTHPQTETRSNGQVREPRASYNASNAVEGENWAPLPAGYGYHQWLFVTCLGPSDRDILIYLLSCNRSGKIYPSLTTMSVHTGISVSNLWHYVKKFSSKRILICPICDFDSIVLKTTKGKNNSYKYDLRPFFTFIKHMNNHWKDDRERYILAQVKILEERKIKYAKRIKNFEGKQEDF